MALIGYSRGADILPFMASRLPADLQEKVELVALLGSERSANFKYHMIDLIADVQRQDDLPTVPEIEKLSGRPLLCFYGAEETNTACPALDRKLATLYEMPGGHHFDRKYGEIASTILRRLEQEPSTEQPGS